MSIISTNNDMNCFKDVVKNIHCLNIFCLSIRSMPKGKPDVKLEGKIGRDNCASPAPSSQPAPALVTEFNLFKLLFTYAKLKRLAERLVEMLLFYRCF